MVETVGSGEVRFGPFLLDLNRRTLSCEGTSIKLASRALDILCVLARAEGQVVTKSQLMDEVWAGLTVEESNHQVHVSNLRKALDDRAGGESFVVTVPSRGYRLLGAHSRVPAEWQDPESRSGLSEISIAVLPFTNLSGDATQDYFVDGIVQDIITGLSRIKWLSVIAQNSSFIYKGRPIDLKQVSQELSCRYVLEGSVRKSASRVRLSAQLIDSQTGIHLWAERFDRLLDDIFAVQDAIAMSVVGAIEPNLRRVEIERVKRKRTNSLDAYELVLRALPFVNGAMVTGADAAIPLLQKAVEIDPQYAGAHALLARCFHFRFSRGGLREEDRSRSIHHARAAMIGSDDATTLAIAALVIWFDEHDVDASFELFDRALTISNSNVVALGNSAFVLAWMGQVEPAIERATRALRLSPFDTLIAYLAIAVAQFHAGRFAEARDAARRAVEANPNFSVPHVLLAVSLVRLGRPDDAKYEARRAIALDPTFTADRWSITVGIVSEVFKPVAAAWDETAS
jgi:TolB-like protein